MADARTNVAFPYTFGAKTGSGAPRTGLVTANFTITVRNPQDTATMAAPTVVEIGGGQYRFDISAAFTLTHGAGAYGVSVELTLAPVDFFADIVTFTVDDADTLAADIAAVQADTDNIQTRLPVALVGGRMDSDVGNMQANTITAAVIATAAIDADAIAAGAIGVSEAPNLDVAVSSRESEASAATRAATNQTEHDATQALIVALNDLSIADVQTALTNQGYTVARAALLDNLDAAISSVLTAISGLNDLSIADVQTALTTQGYTAARALLLDNLDEAVSAAKTLTVAERDAIASALLDLTDAIETGFNLRGAIRIIAAVVAGLSSNGPARQTYLGLDQSTLRADVTSDGSGNRILITSYVP